MIECPTCGLDVTGWPMTVGADGRRRWERPSKWETTQNGNTVIVGGFTHIEGGWRCAR